MQIYNTLTRRKEEFVPMEEGKVKMYACGPTVYDYIHIGNARPLVVFDTMHRYLLHLGYDVQYVVNFTDIDDKIINKAIAEDVPFQEISERYIKAFEENARELNLLESETIHPRATNHIQDMIDFIQDLVDKGAAYDAKDAVYFRVDAAKDYGKLSGKNVEDLQSGARIDINDEKESPVDFALWKKQKDPKEPAWDSPWGPGRPGWHIECSVMNQVILGETIDIHAGGEDLEFPHHENEIAQSETHNCKTFARYWMHNSMILVDHVKMSKSKGNFFTLNDIKKEFDLAIVRLWLLGAHYRSPINFSRETMEQTKNGYERLLNAKENLDRLCQREGGDQVLDLEEAKGHVKQFYAHLDDDLNTSDALASLYEFVRWMNRSLDEKTAKESLDEVQKDFNEMTQVLGLELKRKEQSLEEEVEQLIAERQEARKNKDFKRADEIRDLLKERGITLKDTREGVIWTKES